MVSRVGEGNYNSVSSTVLHRLIDNVTDTEGHQSIYTRTSGTQRWSLDTRVLSQDMVFHVSVLAQSRHLYVLSWLCLKLPCLVIFHVS